jgi:hypothetical protein
MSRPHLMAEALWRPLYSIDMKKPFGMTLGRLRMANQRNSRAPWPARWSSAGGAQQNCATHRWASLPAHRRWHLRPRRLHLPWTGKAAGRKTGRPPPASRPMPATVNAAAASPITSASAIVEADEQGQHTAEPETGRRRWLQRSGVLFRPRSYFRPSRAIRRPAPNARPTAAMGFSRIWD